MTGSPERIDPTAIEEIAGGWFARRRSGRMSAQEARELEAWLNDGPDNRAAFSMIERAWADVEAFRRAPEILALRGRARGRWAGLTGAFMTRAAAACLAVAVIGGGGWGLKSAGVIDFRRFSDQHYATAVGERNSVTLPDGSVVTLNTDTVLRTVAARDRRLVYLDRGQAFFRVAKDADRPFIVHAAGRTVTALGTAFDVRVEGKRFEVTLVEGKVRVEAPAPVTAVAAPAGGPPAAPAVRTTEMLAGDRFVASTDTEWVVAHADTAKQTSWLVGRLKFEDEPLGQIAAEFGRYSNRKIVIDDPVLAARPVSGTFRADDEEAFAEALEIAGVARIEFASAASIRLAAPTVEK